MSPAAATIRARIHESAVKRVTRTYAATIAEIFVEELQNSRRGDATGVRISVSQPAEQATATGETECIVTVADDGVGIADPAVLLSFGENGWSDELVRREDAAGFGFASLARRGCTVSSRPQSLDGTVSPGWKVDLAPSIFSGRPRPRSSPTKRRRFRTERRFRSGRPSPPPRSATPRRTPPGTTRCRSSSRTAPKPKPRAGKRLPRRAFLDGAVHAEAWRGLAFGVFRDRRRGYNDPDLNFFGLTLPVGLPSIETVHGPTWTVRADVHDCPDLELVLPARKEAVENAFLAGDARGRPDCDLPRHGRRSVSAPRLQGPGAGVRSRHRTGDRRRPCCAPGAPPSPMSTTGANRPGSRRQATTPWSWPATRSRPRPRRSGAPPSAPASPPACSRPTAGSTATTGMTASTG